MLDPKSDASYNVTNSATSTQLQATGVSVTDPTAVTGSSYAVSGLSVAAGATAGTSHMSYTVTETPAGGGAPITTTLTTPDYNSASTSVSLALPNGASATGGLSLTVSGTPSASDAFTVAPNSSLFSVLDNAIAAIGSATTGATVKQAVSQALGNIDKSADKIAAARGRAGELLTRADRISTSQDKRSTDLQAARSSAEDLDMISAISEFQNKQTGYQAALQSYAQIQKNSLFNYIG
jgi:flagellar hook-associated protein 3 FlgL